MLASKKVHTLVIPLSVVMLGYMATALAVNNLAPGGKGESILRFSRYGCSIEGQ